MVEVLPFPWNTFQRLQAATDSRIINARTNGREEALTVLLEELAAGKVPPNAETMERRYRTLSANRAKKYRYRVELGQRLVYEHQGERLGYDHCDLLAFRELTRLALAKLLPRDWELLQEVGNGTSYRELARRLGKPVGTLKARVSRLRRQIRNMKVGYTTPQRFELPIARSA